MKTRSIGFYDTVTDSSVLEQCRLCSFAAQTADIYIAFSIPFTNHDYNRT